MSKKIDPNVEVSSDIRKAMAGYVPCVGDSQDIRIAEVYSRVLNFATRLRDQADRLKEIDKVISEGNGLSKNLRKAEKELLSLMKKRKCQKK